MSAGPEDPVSNRWLVLAVLFGAYALSSADRQLVAVLAEPIRLEFGLTDSQLGMLSGFTFALFYTAFGIPIAWLADRMNRVVVIASACLAWSLCTVGSALAGSYLHLALWRIGVAVGEAGGSPPSYSLISDHFPAELRGTALGLYSVGLPFGIAAGTALGGWIGVQYGWRAVFLAFSLPGFVLGIVMLLLIRHPVRGRLDPPSAKPERAAAPRLGETLRNFAGQPVLRQTTVAGCLAALSSYGLMVWLPAFLMRGKGMTLTEIAASYSLISGVAMVAGMIASGYLNDHWGKRNPRAGALIPAFAYAIAAPLVLAAVWVSDWRLALALLALPLALMMTWLPPALATLQNSVPAEERGVTAAVFMLFAGIIGNGGGPFLVGWLSDMVMPLAPAHSLHWALTILCPILLLASLAHFYLARTLEKAAVSRHRSVAGEAIR